MPNKDNLPTREYFKQRLQRLTYDEPEGIYESMHNTAFVLDREVMLLGLGYDGSDINLCAFCAAICADECKTDLSQVPSSEFGEYMDCDCPVSVLFFIAVGAAEMREKLKRYEDAEEAARADNKSLTGPVRIGQTVTGEIVSADAERGVVTLKWDPFSTETKEGGQT